MTPLSLLASFLQVVSDPILLLAPLVVAMATGKPWVVRASAVALAMPIAWFNRIGDGGVELAVTFGLGAAAGLLVAEAWLGVALPLWAMVDALWRRLRGWLGGG